MADRPTDDDRLTPDAGASDPTVPRDTAHRADGLDDPGRATTKVGEADPDNTEPNHHAPTPDPDSEHEKGPPVRRAAPPTLNPRRGRATPGTPAAAAASGADGGSKSRPRPEAPGKRDEPLFGLLLLATLLALAVILSVAGLGAPVRPGSAEAEALAVTVETRGSLARPDDRAGHGWPTVPVRGAVERVDRPPGLTWLHLAASRAGPESGTPADGEPNTAAGSGEVVRRARLVSAVAVLLGVAAIGWLGFCVGRLTTGAFALLIAGSSPVVVWAGKWATADAATFAGIACSVSLGVWAMRPLRPMVNRARQLAGWTLCGGALGGLALVGGPAAWLPALAPLAVTLAVCPRRWSHLAGLAAAVMIGLLTTGPWAFALYGRSVADGQAWLGAWAPDLAAMGRNARYAMWDLSGWWALAWLPWTLWLTAALLQPVSTSSRGSRQRLMIGWGSVLATVPAVALSASDVRAAQLMLWSMPGVTLGLAQVFRRYHDLSEEGRHARLWRALRWPHVAAMATGTVLIVIALRDPALPRRMGVTSHDWLTQQGWPLAASGGVALFLLTMLGIRSAATQHPGRMLASYAGWWAAAMAILAGPIAGSPAAMRPEGAAAVRDLASVIGDARVEQWGDNPANAALVVALGRAVPVVRPHDAPPPPGAEPRVIDPGTLILAPDPATPRGLSPAGRFPTLGWRLFRWRGPASAPPDAATIAAPTP